MARVSQPELKRYLDKKVVINIQGGRRVQGTLRGFDVFLNLVVDDTLEFIRSEGSGNAWKEAASCGTVVSVTQHTSHEISREKGLRTNNHIKSYTGRSRKQRHFT